MPHDVQLHNELNIGRRKNQGECMVGGGVIRKTPQIKRPPAQSGD